MFSKCLLTSWQPVRKRQGHQIGLCIHLAKYLDQLKVRVTICLLSFWCAYRILRIVDDVLNVVEEVPEKPFEFAAPYFGVQVEEPPEDLDDEKLFAPDLGALLS